MKRKKRMEVQEESSVNRTALQIGVVFWQYDFAQSKNPGKHPCGHKPLPLYLCTLYLVLICVN